VSACGEIVAVDAVRLNGSGMAAVKKNLNHPAIMKMNYHDLFIKTRVLVKNPVVWTEECVVAPIHPETAPADMEEIVGPKLPDFIYYMLVRCWISPTAIQTATSGNLVELHPLCTGTLEEFMRFVNGSEITRLRAQALAFLSLHLEKMQFKEIEYFLWHEPANPHKISFGQEILSFDNSQKWTLSEQLLKDALAANTFVFYFQFLIAFCCSYY
jgi:hypothetical protein